MAKLDIESKMEFDRSVGTEDRFNLRKWLEQFIVALNKSNPKIWEEVIPSDFVNTGLTDEPLGLRDFISYMRNQYELGEYVARYPKLKIKYREDMFMIKGTFESFLDNILTFEGDAELIIEKQEDTFHLIKETLYPRFR